MNDELKDGIGRVLERLANVSRQSNRVTLDVSAEEIQTALGISGIPRLVSEVLQDDSLVRLAGLELVEVIKPPEAPPSSLAAVFRYKVHSTLRRVS